MSKMLSVLDKSCLEKSIDFDTYFEDFREKATAFKSGEQVDSLYAEYLPVNFQRLKRGIKQSTVSSELLGILLQIEAPIYWLVLTEPWCGDAAQSLGFLNAIAKASEGKIKMNLLYRDENLELMDQFLTNGGRSIPKLIQLNEKHEVSGTWGPRPKDAQDLVLKMKAAGQPYADVLHAWYAKDKNRSLEIEIRHLLSGKNI